MEDGDILHIVPAINLGTAAKILMSSHRQTKDCAPFIRLLEQGNILPGAPYKHCQIRPTTQGLMNHYIDSVEGMFLGTLISWRKQRSL